MTRHYIKNFESPTSNTDVLHRVLQWNRTGEVGQREKGESYVMHRVIAQNTVSHNSHTHTCTPENERLVGSQPRKLNVSVVLSWLEGWSRGFLIFYMTRKVEAGVWCRRMVTEAAASIDTLAQEEEKQPREVACLQTHQQALGTLKEKLLLPSSAPSGNSLADMPRHTSPNWFQSPSS